MTCSSSTFTLGLAVSLAILSTASPARAWGPLGHKLVATTGASLATGGRAFWAANRDSMGWLTNVPDNAWKSGSQGQENSAHWFQPDGYFDDPAQFDRFPHSYSSAEKKYGADTLDKNGTAPWRIGQLYDLAVAAIRRGDFARGLQMAGTMSHYVGDLAQPLHDTTNYDGQDTHDKGIHAFFESSNLNQADSDQLASDVLAGAEALLADSRFVARVRGKPVDAAFDEVDRAYPLIDDIIQIDLKQGRRGKGADAQLAIAVDRMADGAATLSIILSELWQDAGNPSQGASVQVSTPQWVPLDYESLAASLADDCL